MKTTKKMIKRMINLMPDGIPRWIRVYDLGPEHLDRFTVVYTGNYRGESVYRSMSVNPFHPQGLGLIGFSLKRVDTNDSGFAPDYGRKCHLGKRMFFWNLPEGCRTLVVADYIDIWKLPEAESWAYMEVKRNASNA